jgi:hypothetical protein
MSVQHYCRDIGFYSNKRLMRCDKGVGLSEHPSGPTLIHVLSASQSGTQSTATAIQMFTVEVRAPATTMEGSAGS